VSTGETKVKKLKRFNNFSYFKEEASTAKWPGKTEKCLPDRELWLE
jgi:hypothetical protein